MRQTVAGPVAGLMLAIVPIAVSATDLQPRTVAAFDRYVAETERQNRPSLADEARFLWIDSQDERRRRAGLDTLQKGGLQIERLETKQNGNKIDVPGGIIHHWLGAVFVPGASVDAAVALMQDYDRHAEIFKPAIARSKTLSRDGDLFRMYLRFSLKRIITVVVNSEHEARFSRPSPTRAYSHLVSTRIAEVDEPGTSNELEKPVGRDGGYLWRLNSDWRFLERDGGTYIQCESITLSRSIPMGLGWLIGPFVTSIPKDSLTFMLKTTRDTLMR